MKTLKAIAANLRDAHDQAVRDIAHSAQFGWSAVRRVAERLRIGEVLDRIGRAVVHVDETAAGWVRPARREDGDTVRVRLSEEEKVTDPDRAAAVGLNVEASRMRMQQPR